MDPQNIPPQTQESVSLEPQPKFSPFLILGGIIIVLLMGFVGYYLGKSSNKSIISPTPTIFQQKACRKDAKICPDGSTVERIPPNCEFKECPSDQSKGWNFSGPINSISYDCHMDGICGILVGKGFVIVDSGESLNNREPKGTIPDGLLDENKKNDFLGKNVEIYAGRDSSGKTDSYTLFGSSEFYIKLMNSPTTQIFCGGIMGKTCPTGYNCKLDGAYPDAGGTCIKE